jgi:hypothetical protein
MERALIVITLPPDRSTCSDTIYYRTSIFSSEDSTEARKQLMSRYKYMCSYSHTAVGSFEINEVRSKLETLDDDVHHPIWSQAMILDYASSSPTDTITLPHTPPYGSGETVYLTNELTPGGVYLGYAKVTGVSGKTITLDKSFSISKGTMIAPMRIGKLETSVGSKALSGIYQTFDITFKEY